MARELGTIGGRVLGDIPAPTAVQPQMPAQDLPLSEKIWNGLVGGASKVTDVLGLHGAVDTIGTNLAAVAGGAKGALDLAQGKKPSESINYLEDPSLKRSIGAGVQIAPVFASAAAPVTGVVKNIAQGALLGAASQGGKALAEDKSYTQAAKDTAIGAAIGGAVSGATALAGKFLERVGDKIQYSIIKPTKVDIEDGFNLATVKKYNLGGPLTSVFKKTESRMDDLTSQLNDKLAASDSHINLNEVFDKTVKEIQGSKKLFSFGATGKQSNILDELQNEIANVGSDLTIPDAQVVKRAAGHFGAWQYGARDPESTAREKIYNVFYTKLKEAIEEGSPAGVKELNKEMSELIPVLNAVIRRIPIAERNNALSLTDIIALTGSAIEPRAMGVTLVNLLSKSGGVANILSKLGPAVAKTGAASGLGASQTTPLLSGSENTTQETSIQQPQSPITSQNPTTDPFKDKIGMTEDEFHAKYDKFIEGAQGAGSLERLGPEYLKKIAKKVHLEDVGEMRDIIDYAAKEYRPKGAHMINQLELMARQIWEHYIPDIQPPKTIRGIGSDFARLFPYMKQHD